MTGPVAIDLFSGCGGLTLGLKQAGFNVVGAVDNDPLAVETYRANHPEVATWQVDIRELPALAMKRKLQIRKGEVDLLAGCPPCQGFSRMRTRNGNREIQDPRNDLVYEFLRFAKEFMPRAVMMENVPGLYNDLRVKILRRELENLGYHCECRILDAADYGVPQRRHRMILLAGRNGPLDFARPAASRRTVRDAIGSMPKAGESGDSLHDVPEHRTEKVKRLIRMIPKDGGGRSHLGVEYQLPCHREFGGFLDVYGRMAWDDVSPTITGGCSNPSKGRFLHPEEDRAITLREAALLQTFPRNYFFSSRRGKDQASTMIGNALPPEFIRRHALSVRRYLTEVM